MHGEGTLHRFHGTLDAGAVSTRRGKENGSTHATMVAPVEVTCGHLEVVRTFGPG
jgi:hypothetical protein